MDPVRQIHFVVAILLSLILPVHAQTQSANPASDQRVLELVDQLKEVVDKADKDPRSDPGLIRQLRELVRRYDWPWRVSLLHDDFRDGSYDPSWIVSSGDFRVIKGSGLRTVLDNTTEDRRLNVDRRSESRAADILTEIFDAVREREDTRDLRVSSPSAAEIYTHTPISNAFAIKVQLTVKPLPDSNKRLEFGPYINPERDAGYRIAYESGHTPSFSLLRVAPGRSSVIETYDRFAAPEDGSPHLIEWRRGLDGEMVVLLDGKEIVRTVDRAHSASFDGFTLVNKGGVYDVKDIAIFGTGW